MIAVLFLLSVIWLGFVLDQEFDLSRGDVPVRLAAAIVVGAFCGSWIVFLLSCLFGFGVLTIAAATALVLIFNLLFGYFRGRMLPWLASPVRFDKAFWQAASFAVALITLYFCFCVWTNAAGDIRFRGNTRDLAFHMSTVSAFAEQTAFPPFNPQSAPAKLSYHFMANFFSAILEKGGFALFYSLKLPMVLLAFSLSTLTCHLLYTVLRARLATLFAALLFFLGHIGVVNLAFGLAGYPSGNVPLSLTSWRSIEDHISYPYFNFTNVLIDYFQPQLPFLFGFPLATLVLVALYRKSVEKSGTNRASYFLLAIVAFLPLLHMHTFLTVGPLVGLMVMLEKLPARERSRRTDPLTRSIQWLVADDVTSTPIQAADPRQPLEKSAERSLSIVKIFALLVAAAVIGLQFGFILSQQKVPGFSGFDVTERLGPLPEIPDFLNTQRFWFWLRAAGLPLAMGLVAFGLALWHWRKAGPAKRRSEFAIAAFFCTGALYFLVINFYRFTPNWGDNNKFFLYWNLALCLYAGRLLATGYARSGAWRIGACALVALSSVIPTGIEWGERLRRTPERLFSANDQLVADWIRLNTQKNAVFLSANSTVHLVPALAGRRVVNGSYTRETGFADSAIEDLVARAFREADPELVSHVHVTHMIVGPEEEALYQVSRTKMGNRHKVLFDQLCGGVRYTVYEVRPRTPEMIERERATEDARPFVWLSEIEPRSVQQFGTLRYDRTFDLGPMKLRGRSFPTGLGTHAPSEIIYELGGNYVGFESEIGLDDSQIGGIGSVVFEVWLDEQLAYRSSVLRAGEEPASVKVKLGEAQTLRLVVTDAGDANHSDHADWANARLVKK